MAGNEVQTEQSLRTEGQEPFRTNGFEMWTELFPTWAFPCAHPWDMAGWTNNLFRDISAHPSTCTACEGYMEFETMGSWDSGNWGPDQVAWVNEMAHNNCAPKIEGWFAGHPVIVTEEGECVVEWDELPLGDVFFTEISADEMYQHQVDAQLLREKDEFQKEMCEEWDKDSDDGSDIESVKLTAEEKKANFKPNDGEKPEDFQVRYQNYVYHLDAMEHFKQFGQWPSGYNMLEDD